MVHFYTESVVNNVGLLTFVFLFSLHYCLSFFISSLYIIYTVCIRFIIYILYRSNCNSKVRDIAKSRAQLTPIRTTVAYSRTKNFFMLDNSSIP
jgi:hypothetical protein